MLTNPGRFHIGVIGTGSGSGRVTYSLRISAEERIRYFYRCHRQANRRDYVQPLRTRGPAPTTKTEPATVLSSAPASWSGPDIGGFCVVPDPDAGGTCLVEQGSSKPRTDMTIYSHPFPPEVAGRPTVRPLRFSITAYNRTPRRIWRDVLSVVRPPGSTRLSAHRQSRCGAKPLVPQPGGLTETMQAMYRPGLWIQWRTRATFSL